jgi:hypothetical protein
LALFSFFKREWITKTPDKTMSRMEDSRGNSPAPGARKDPNGYPKDFTQIPKPNKKRIPPLGRSRSFISTDSLTLCFSNNYTTRTLPPLFLIVNFLVFLSFVNTFVGSPLGQNFSHRMAKVSTSFHRLNPGKVNDLLPKLILLIKIGRQFFKVHIFNNPSSLFI